MFATEVPGEVIAGVVAFAVAVFVGMGSWALLLLVKLSGVVAALEAEYKERSADHERRITYLESHPLRPFGEGG